MHRFVQRYWEVRVKVFPRSVAILASFFLFGFLFAQTAKTQQAANSIDPKTYGGMKWRLIGPFRGGRALAVTGVTSQPNTYYFGAVAGGVWKTTDGGVSWDPLFDKQTTSSIGSIAVSDSDPNVVYVGTGEACIRGNISFGDGVYRSNDGGKTWNSGGDKDGFYRSNDDGTTWKRVEGNGIPEGPLGRIGVAVSGADSNVVYALIEAKKGGLYRSDDGGEHWTLINEDHRFRQRAWYFTHVWADPKSVSTADMATT